MRKKILLAVFLWVYAYQGNGQASVNATTLPPFSLLLTTGKHFTHRDIQKDKSLLLIYFEPSCDHCRDFTKKLTAKMKDFSTAQILMISYVPLQPMQQFYKDLQLNRFANLLMGTEENKFVVPNHFAIIKFPFTAVFNKTGKLVASFREEPSLDKLTSLLKK